MFRLTLFSLVFTSQNVLSQPDAGQLLQQQPRPPSAIHGAPAQLVPEIPAAEIDTSPRIAVEGFRIQGALLISESELTDLLQPLVGRQLSLRQLEGAASQITAYYASRGYLARVIVPPQDIKDGIVTLQVIEGKRGALQVINPDAGVDTARVQGFINNRLPAGGHLDMGALGESLTILNEQPGVKVGSSLRPGKQEGAIDLVVTATAKPLISFNADLNNHGSRATGEYQASAGLILNNPSGHFDALSLLANLTDGNNFGRLDYSLAVGNSGLRLGANASSLRYKLTQDSFAALQGRGTADTWGLALNYPLARKSDFNLSLTGSFDDKRLVDRTVAGETGNRHVTVTSLGINGFIQGPNGMTSFGTNLNIGDSDQRNAAALAADQAARRIQGGFSKLGYTLAHLMPLSSEWTFNTSLRGQFASKNLDSSERMSLGGPGAIRAYPAGEASGDEAWLFNLNLGYRYNDNLAATFFLDTGSVKLNRTLWANWNAGNPQLPNRYDLSGLGIGMDWRISPELLLSASLAVPLGSNPGRDANNNNSDGSPQNRLRGWIGLTAKF